MIQPRAAALLLAGLATAGEAAAQAVPPADTRSALSFILENDSFAARTDRYYTNGFRLGYSSPESNLPPAVAWLDRGLAGVFGPAQTRWNLALGQNIYTPVNKRLRNPDPNDRPYAGYSYLEAGLDRRTTVSLDRFTFQLGVVGPTSLARQVQDAVHDIIGSSRPRGWRYQLRDEPTFNLGYERTWRVPVANVTPDLGFDVLPTASFAAGTVATYAQLGMRVRFGQGLQGDFGPARIRPAVADSPMPVGEGFGYYVFGGVSGRAVARDITLDGNTYRDSRSVDRKVLVGDLEVGAAVFWRNVRFSFTHVWRSPEFDGQRRAHRFGSFGLTVAF